VSAAPAERSQWPEAREALDADLHALLNKLNVAADGTVVIPGEYLEVVVTKIN